MLNYDFRVSEKAVKVADSDVIIPGKKCIVHADGTPISIVSDRYKVVTHSDLVLPFEEALKSLPDFMDYDVTTSLPLNGAQMYRRYTFRKIALEPRLGDIIRLQLELNNSLDGKIKGGFKVSGLRLKCLNGQTIADALFEMLTKHSAKFNIKKIVDSIKMALPLFDETVKKWKTWHDVKINADDVVRMLEKTSIAEKTQEKIIEQFKKEDKTKYGAFQAMTYVITHEVKPKKADNTRIHQLRLENQINRIFY